MTTNGKRKRDDELLVLAIATGSSVCNAAELTGFGERTVRRRLDEPEFVARIDAVRLEIRDRTVGKLTHAMTDAVDTLQELLSADTDSIRLGAARSILDSCTKLTKTDGEGKPSQNVQINVANRKANEADESRETMEALRELRNAGISIDDMVDNQYQAAPRSVGVVKELPPPEDTELSDQTKLDEVRWQLKANISGKRYNPFIDR